MNRCGLMLNFLPFLLICLKIHLLKYSDSAAWAQEVVGLQKWEEFLEVTSINPFMTNMEKCTRGKVIEKYHHRVS